MRIFTASTALLAVLLAVTTAHAELRRVTAFGYPSISSGGEPEIFATKAGIPASVQSIAAMQRLDDSVREVELYCVSTPGPRFMQVDGVFYTLNGKSRRAGAFVVTGYDRVPVRDSTEAPSPFSADPTVVLQLVDEAKAAC